MDSVIANSQVTVIKVFGSNIKEKKYKDIKYPLSQDHSQQHQCVFSRLCLLLVSVGPRIKNPSTFIFFLAQRR